MKLIDIYNQDLPIELQINPDEGSDFLIVSWDHKVSVMRTTEQQVRDYFDENGLDFNRVQITYAIGADY